MITTVWVGEIERGKEEAATEFMRKVKARLDEILHNDTRRLQRAMTGESCKLFLIADFDSLAAYDEVQRRRNADKGFQKLRQEMQEKMYFSASRFNIHEDIE